MCDIAAKISSLFKGTQQCVTVQRSACFCVPQNALVFFCIILTLNDDIIIARSCEPNQIELQLQLQLQRLNFRTFEPRDS